MTIKIYNNKLIPHYLNFPYITFRKIYSNMYLLKIGNYVIEWTI